jgi:hypothetical protein
VVLLVLGAIVAVSLVVPFGRHQWAESLVRQPSPYTALSFDDPAGLPTTVVSGQEVRFTFTVGNNELRSLTYRYLLTSAPSKVKAFGGSFGGGSVTVPVGQSRRVRVSADPKCAGSPCRIAVVLVGPAEVIDFNVQVSGLETTAGQGQ